MLSNIVIKADNGFLRIWPNLEGEEDLFVTFFFDTC